MLALAPFYFLRKQDTSGLEGKVEVVIKIDEKGRVVQARIMSSEADVFNQAAIDALVVRYTISNEGGGSQSYEFTMEQTYAEVTYTAGAAPSGVVIFRRRMEAA